MTTLAISIKGWDKHYENNRSRELRRPEWLSLPNSFDGRGYMELCDHPAGMSHYGAWCMLLAAASRMPTRGLLVSDSGQALSLKDIARMTRGSVKVFEEALPRLVDIGWIEMIDMDNIKFSAASGESADGQKNVDGAGIPHEGAGKVRLYGKGNRNGKEDLKEKEKMDLAPPSSSNACATPKPPETPAAAARIGFTRLEGSLDASAAKRAIEQADVLALVKAFKCNCEGARADEWVRDTTGHKILSVLVTLWRGYSERKPIREPSGYRKAYELTIAERSGDHWYKEAKKALGLP